MVQSNIISIFTGGDKSARDSGDTEFVDTDCIPCTVIQLITATGLGIYFQADHLFKEKDGKIDLKKHPKIWQYSIRTLGIGLIGLGIQRMYHVYKLSKETFG